MTDAILRAALPRPPAEGLIMLQGKGLAMQPDDYEVGYRLTTQGAALAEGL